MTILKQSSYKSGAVISVMATLFWKFTSFANSLLIAYFFGTQLKTDIYFYLITIMGLVFAFIDNLNTSVIIPQAMYLRSQKEDSEKPFLNVFLWGYVILAILIIFIGAFFATDIFTLFSKFSLEYLTQNDLMLKLSFLYLACYSLCYFLLHIMNMYKLFMVNFLLPLNAFCPLFMLICFQNTFGLKAMLIGFSVSFLIQIFCFLAIMKKSLFWKFSTFQLNFERRVKTNAFTSQILVLGNFLIGMLPMYLMSSLGTGFISSYNYAKQLTDSPNEILTSKITGIFSLQLNENASNKNYDELNKNYISANYLILFIMTPLVVFSFYFAPDIINLFFKRGNFTDESAYNVVKFLRPMLLLLITTILTPFAGAVICATRKIKESFKYMIFRDIVILFALYFFITRFGAFAYPYVQLGGSLFGYFIVAWFFKNNIPEIKFYEPIKDASFLLLLNIVAVILPAFLGQLLTNFSAFWRLLFCGILFLSILFIIYIPTLQAKRILRFTLGAFKYALFLNIVPKNLKKFFI